MGAAAAMETERRMKRGWRAAPPAITEAERSRRMTAERSPLTSGKVPRCFLGGRALDWLGLDALLVAAEAELPATDAVGLIALDGNDPLLSLGTGVDGRLEPSVSTALFRGDRRVGSRLDEAPSGAASASVLCWPPPAELPPSIE